MSSDFQNRLRKNLEHPTPAEHPAPDVLNAYLEKVLTPAEERQVTEHLAACGECREVVFLATSAAEEPVQQLATAEAPVRHVRWWAWALPIAAVAVVAVLVSEPNLLKSKPPVQMAQARHEKPQASAPAESGKSDELKADKTLGKTETPSTYMSSQQVAPSPSVRVRPAAPPAAPPPAPEQSALAKEKDTNQPARNEIATAKLEAGRAEEPKSAVVNGAPARAPAGDQLQTLNSSQGAAANLTDGTARRDETVAVTAEASSAAVQANRATRSKAANLDAKVGPSLGGFSNAQPYAKKADASALWRVTAAGGVEHFLLGKWEPALSDSGSRFLAVTTYGDNVWAGGKNLALYHSPDNGVTWERQTLRVRIAADINQIVFTSATDGVLTTNLGTSFETHDGGKRWVQGK